MGAQYRFTYSLVFLALFVCGQFFELAAIGASLWLSRNLPSQVMNSGGCTLSNRSDDKSTACRCPAGRCRGGETCGCGHVTRGREIAIQRFRIPCHTPPPPVGLFELPPRTNYLYSVMDLTLISPATVEGGWYLRSEMTYWDYHPGVLAPPPQYA